MALSRLAQYSASYTAQDDDRALEAAGFAWAQAAGYDVPYDVAGCVGRLQVLGGNYEIESVPGQGTKVNVTIPLER